MRLFSVYKRLYAVLGLKEIIEILQTKCMDKHLKFRNVLPIKKNIFKNKLKFSYIIFFLFRLHFFK